MKIKLKLMSQNYSIKKIRFSFIAILFCVQIIQSQVVINTLSELKSYMTQDNVNAIMASGTYYINSSHTGEGNLFPNPIMMEFTGSNSTYDFTGVTFEFDTEILDDYGNIEVVEMRTYGDNNVMKNLTMVDVGTGEPRNRARAIHLDGLNNRIEGFHITVKGSYPYGYGDLFGKGGGSVIGHRKHSGILVRGDGNHIKDCTLIHRSYGHGIFIQGGKNVLIEGVYIEGDDLRTTDDVLLESGTAADNVNFMTVWGYTVPAGYMFSKQEDGIRTYASAGLYTNDKTGDDTVSYTENVTIKDCTVKHMRSGYSFAFGSGDFLIENSSSLECESGFTVLSGGVIKNCSADAKYGAVYGNAYDWHGSITADITILNSENGYGPHHLAYIGGSDSNITLRTEDGSVAKGRSIQMAGEKNDMRMLNGVNASQTRHSSTDNILTNYTGYPVVLDQGVITINEETYNWEATGNTINTCSIDDVINNGTNNTVTEIDCESENVALTGVATQSSVAYDGVPARAIDGDTNGSFGGDSVTHTDPSVQDAWWQVSLNSESIIGEIKIFNRTGRQSYIDRLANFGVYVYDENGEETFSKIFENDPPNTSVSIDAGGVKAKVVKIVQLDDSVVLSLAEVEVYSTSTLSVEDKEFEKAIHVYPNPVESALSVSLIAANINNQKTKLVLYSIEGQKLLEQEVFDITNEIDLDLSHLTTGVYFLSIKNENKRIIKKIIKK